MVFCKCITQKRGETMEENEKKELEKLREQRKKQLNRQNKYIAVKYDRLNFTVKKGLKEIITEHYKKQGFNNLSQYLTALMLRDGCPIDQDIPPEPENINFFE